MLLLVEKDWQSIMDALCEIMAAVMSNVALEIVSPVAGSVQRSQRPAIDNTQPFAALTK
jgi:hypothetical protein